jgi:hypothetical protein
MRQPHLLLHGNFIVERYLETYPPCYTVLASEKTFRVIPKAADVRFGTSNNTFRLPTEIQRATENELAKLLSEIVRKL